MKRTIVALFGMLLAAIAAALAWSPVRAQAGDDATVPPFISPYDSPEPLEKYLVFTAAPRADVPDGQIHWTDQEVPGIDVLGPDGDVRSMCPDDGLAWSLEGGDPFGGGQFVAIECEGQATGWQVIAFHLCEVRIGASIDNAHRLYTHVPSGAVVGRECDGHTHLSLGYWASVNAQKSLPCPQWYVQGRYWVNPACLAQTHRLPATATRFLAGDEDWELRYLTPQVLNPLRQLAAAAVSGGLLFYIFQAFVRPVPPKDYNRKTGPAFEATIKSGVWLGFLVLLIVVSIGPVWPVGGARFGGYTADDRRYQAVAEEVGYGDWRLLESFYAVAVPRDAAGHPTRGDQPGKVFPPEAAAAIPFGETNADTWGTVDPTLPGPYGRYRAWDAVTERWPPSSYERFILSLTVSRQAQHQREGLQAIADSPALQRLGRQLGKTIRAEDLYGSSAGAVGRTQILPGHFAPGGICGDIEDMDVWNDPPVVAECTTRYLTVSGCWGSWWANGDVWSALCGYNPGAWNDETHQWYWEGYSGLQTFGINLLALAVIPILYQLYRGMTRPAASTSTNEPPASEEAGSGTAPRPTGLIAWAEDWLRWMGNGEPHRGTLVVLVLVFWSMLYWNWPAPDIRSFPFILTFSTWGLLTIFGLVAIRQMFFRQTNLPSQEVSASGDTKKSR